jgi:hypothetical protein
VTVTVELAVTAFFIIYELLSKESNDKLLFSYIDVIAAIEMR